MGIATALLRNGFNPVIHERKMMKKSPFTSTSDLMTVFFILLYSAGVFINIKNDRLLIAGIWGLLLLANLVLLVIRHLKKGDKK